MEASLFFALAYTKASFRTISNQVSMESLYWVFPDTFVTNLGGFDASDDVPSEPVPIVCHG